MMHIMHLQPRGAIEFLVARLCRIAPMYYLVTIFAVLVGHGFWVNSWRLLESFAFLKLSHFLPVLQVGWTLEYEFIFYFLCSISLLFFTKKIHFKVLIVCAGLILLTLIQDVLLFPEKAYGPFIEFLQGICIFYLFLRIRTKQITWIIPAIGVSLSFFVLYSAQHYFFDSGALRFRFLGYGIPAAALVFFFLLLEDKLPRIKLLELLGNASYSIYLTHLTLIYLYLKYANSLSLPNNPIVLLACISTLGVMTYWFIEKPLLEKLDPKKLSNKILSTNAISSLPKTWQQRL